MKMHKTAYTILFCINVLLIISLVILPLAYKGKTIQDCIPSWGDEVWWWQQTNAVSTYGHPLGYWGYNGKTATWGTYATWGALAAQPYGLFGSIFGWSYFSFIYANIFYQIIATIIFILLTKPNLKGLIYLALINSTQVIRNAYLMIAMQESVRSALGLIAFGLLYWLYNCSEGKELIWKELIICIYLLIISQIYMIWSIFFLPLFLFINKKIKLQVRLLVSGLETGIIVFATRWLVHLTSSPFASITASNALLENVNNNVTYLFNMLCNTDEPFFQCFHGGIFVIIIISFFYIVHFGDGYETKRDRRTLLIASFIPIAFILGHIILYDTTKWTFTRAMSIAMMEFCFASILLKQKKVSAIICVWGIICTIMFHTEGMFSLFVNENRFKSEAWEQSIIDTKAVMSNMTVSNDDAFPWNYTVATYFTSPYPIALSIPRGYSINAMLDGRVRTQAKWVVIGKGSNQLKADELRKEFTNLGYGLSDESDTIIVLNKNSQIYPLDNDNN